MYRVYTTECFVLASKHAGEANSYFFLLTRELGHITAFAQGVRELKSKLRYSMERYAYVQISLIRGKEKWRLTNASKLSDFKEIGKHREKLQLQSKLCALLERLMKGEEEDKRLFDEVVASLRFLSVMELSAEGLKDYELLSVLRILDCLGYVAPRDNWCDLLGVDMWQGGVLPDIRQKRAKLFAAVNESLYHSQL